MARFLRSLTLRNCTFTDHHNQYVIAPQLGLSLQTLVFCPSGPCVAFHGSKVCIVFLHSGRRYGDHPRPTTTEDVLDAVGHLTQLTALDLSAAFPPLECFERRREDKGTHARSVARTLSFARRACAPAPCCVGQPRLVPFLLTLIRAPFVSVPVCAEVIADTTWLTKLKLLQQLKILATVRILGLPGLVL